MTTTTAKKKNTKTAARYCRSTFTLLRRLEILPNGSVVCSDCGLPLAPRKGTK